MIKIFFTLVLCIICYANLLTQVQLDPWIHLREGILLGFFPAPAPFRTSLSPVIIVKIDPDFFSVDLYCSSQFQNQNRTVREWAEASNLLVVTNAGMFGKDLSTSVGYLKTRDHLNNPQVNSRHKTILACGPLVSGIPPVQIIDLTCQDFSRWHNRYHSFLQSIRMISCNQKNVWQQQEEKWQLTVAGTDKHGNLLLIHSGSAYTVHDFIEILLQLPVKIHNAMYLEGGIQAVLYISMDLLGPDILKEKQIQEFYTSGYEHGWTIPNVIGIKHPERSGKK